MLYIYHYFEKGLSPFLTLSDLLYEEAIAFQNSLKSDDNVYARRDYDGKYLFFRKTVERNMRAAFIEKGGKPARESPIYFILGKSHETNAENYREWYKTPDYIEMPLDDIAETSISFTYGDSFVVNHPEHHDQNKYAERVHTKTEIISIITARGWPQCDDSAPFWVPRYIEAQLWI